MSGPATKPAPAANPACAAFGPIYVSRQDVLTDDTARQVLAHNETWRLLCSPAALSTKPE